MTVKGMMIFARPPGSGYPNQLEAIIPYGSTKAYSQRPTLFYKDFSYPADPLDMVSVEYPSLFCQIQDSCATSAV